MRKIKRPKIGEYVLVTKWSDKDPKDPWRVGFVTALIITKDRIRYRVDDDIREYKHCWRISEEEGRAWIEAHLTKRAGVA
jgi:hypothetical protein